MTTVEEKLARIKREYERDLATMPPAVNPDDIPAFYECITPEWLSHILCRDHAQAKVRSYRLDEKDSGTSNRRRIFVEYNAAGTELGLPRSVFCKASHDLLNRMLMSASAAHSEVTFYRSIRPDLDIEAPRAYFAALDTNSYRSIVVLEDLAQHVTFCRADTSIDRGRVEGQLALLATMHGRYYQSHELEGTLAGVYTWSDRFMRLVKQHDLEGACRRGFLAAERVIPPAVFSREQEVWPATLASVRMHDDLPQTLNHGDVHLKNWYVTHAGAMGLNDFQVIFRGHWARDVAYVLATALTVENRRNWERDLLRFYLDRLAAAGGPHERLENLWTFYRQQMMTVLAWWTVTMAPSASMPDMQPVETTLTFLERIGQAIADIESLDAFSD